MPSLKNIAYWIVVLLPLIMLLDKAPSDIALSLVAVLFVIHTIITKDLSWLKKTWIRVAMLAWCYIMARSLFTTDIGESFGRAASWVRFILFAVALEHWLFNMPKLFERTLKSLAASITLLAGDCIFQYIVGYDILGHAKIVIYQKGEWFSTRLTGPFGRPRCGIMLTWLTIPFTYWAIHKWQKKWLVAAITLLAFTAVILSGERMALLLFLVGMGLIICTAKHAFKWLVAGGLVMCLLAATLALLQPKLLDRQVYSIIRTAQTFKQTPYGWVFNTAQHAIAHNPVFGVGMKQFQPYCETLEKPVRYYKKCHRHAHNPYLEWWAENGIIGLGFFLVLIAIWAKTIWRAVRTYKDPIIMAFAIGLIIRFFPLSITSSIFTASAGVPLWWAIGLVLAYISSLNKQTF